jgi:hypothetical protein
MENHSMKKRKVYDEYENFSSHYSWNDSQILHDDEILTVFINGFSKDEFEMNKNQIMNILEKDFGRVYKFCIKEPFHYGRAYLHVIFDNIKAIDNICYHHDARIEQCANYSQALDSNEMKKVVKLPIFLESLRRKLHIAVSYKSLIAFEERNKQNEFVNPAKNDPWFTMNQNNGLVNSDIKTFMNDLLIENKNIMSLIKEKSISEKKIHDIHESCLNTMQDKLKSMFKSHEKKTEYMYNSTKEMYKKMKVMHDAIMHGESKEDGEVSDNSD